MPWIVYLSPQQLVYVQELIDDIRDVDYEEEEDLPGEWPYVDVGALVIPDQIGLSILRDALLRAVDEWERGRRKKMVENILDHVDVATGREKAVPAGMTIEVAEFRRGRMRYYTVVGPWPVRWPK